MAGITESPVDAIKRLEAENAVLKARYDMHVSRHLDVLTHFAKTDPDLVRKVLDGVENIDMRPHVSVARDDLYEVMQYVSAPTDDPIWKPWNRLDEALEA